MVMCGDNVLWNIKQDPNVCGLQWRNVFERSFDEVAGGSST